MKHETGNGFLGTVGMVVTAMSFTELLHTIFGIIGAAVAIYAGIDTVIKNKLEKEAHRKDIESSKVQIELAKKQLRKLDDKNK